jgi:hypothetical protein
VFPSGGNQLKNEETKEVYGGYRLQEECKSTKEGMYRKRLTAIKKLSVRVSQLHPWWVIRDSAVGPRKCREFPITSYIAGMRSDRREITI